MKIILPTPTAWKLKFAFVSVIIFLYCITSLGQQAPKDYYWVGGSGSWQSPTTHWATTSGGAVFHQSVPSQFDRVYFDANSFSAAGEEVVMTAEGFCSEFRSLDVLPGVKFTTSKPLNVFDGFSIDSNMVYSQTSASLIISAGGFYIGNNANFSVSGGNHTLTDGDFKVLTGGTYYNNGTLSVASGSFTVQSGATFSHNSTISIPGGQFTIEEGGSFTNSGNLTVSNGNVLVKRDATFYQNGGFSIGVGNLTLEPKTTFTQYSDLNMSNGSINIGDSVTWTKNNSIYQSGGDFNIGTDNNIYVNGGNVYCYNGDMNIGQRSKYQPNCCQTYIPNGSMNFDTTVIINAGGNIIIGQGDLVIASGMNWTCNGSLQLYNGSLTVEAGANFAQNSSVSAKGSLDLDPAANITGSAQYYLSGTGPGLYIKSGNRDLRRLQIDGTNAEYTFLDDVILSSNGLFLYGNGNVINFNNKKVDVYHFYSWTSNPQTLNLTGTDTIFVKGQFRVYNNTTVNGDPVVYFKGTDHFYFIGSGENPTKTYSKVYMNAQNTGNTQIQFQGRTIVKSVEVLAEGLQSLYFESPKIENYSILFNRNQSYTQYTQFSGASDIDTFNLVSSYNINTNLVTNGNNHLGRFNIEKLAQWTLGANNTQTLDTLVHPILGACGDEFLLNSNSTGTAGTISMATGTLSADWLKMRDCTATGGATFNADNTVNFGNVTGWNINAIPPRNFYWVGGSGNWNDGSHWSLTSGGTPLNCALPNQVDNVFFDANSFSSSGEFVNVNVTVDVNDMTWGNVVQGAQFKGGSEVNLWGSLVLNKNMVYNLGNNLNFVATTPGQTITTDSVRLKQVYFGRSTSSNSATWTLLDHFDNDGSWLYFQYGKLITNGQNIKTFGFHNWFGPAASIDWTGTDSVVVQYAFYSYPNTSWTSRPELVKFESTNHFYVYGGSHTFNDILMNALSTGASYISLQQNLTARDITINATGTQYMTLYHNITARDFTFEYLNPINANQTLDFQTNPGNFRKLKILSQGLQQPNVYWRYHNTQDSVVFNNIRLLYLEAGYTKTIHEGMDIVQGACDNRIPFYSNSTYGYITLDSSASLSADWVNLKNIKVQGGGTATATNVLDLGGNVGWNITPVPTTNFYWVGGSGNWSDKNHWSFTSGGTPGTCPVPTQTDNVFFDVNSFTAPNQYVNVNTSADCLNMTWNNVNFPRIIGGSSLNIYGSMSLDPKLSWQHTGWTYFRSNTTGNTVTTKGVNMYLINFAGIGEWTLGDDFNAQYDLYVNSGSFVSGGNSITLGRNFYCWTGAVTSVDLTGTDTVSVKEQFRIYPNNFTLTMDEAVVKFTGTNNFYFTGGNQTYTDIVFDAQNTGYSVIQLDYSNTIRNLKINAAGYQRVNMQSGSTYNDVTMLFNTTTTNNPTVYVSGNNTFNDMTITSIGTAGPYIYLYNNNSYNNLIIAGVGTRIYIGSNYTQSVNDALALGNGSYPVFLQSTSQGTQGTISKPTGAVCMDYIWLRDVKIVGAGPFNAGNTSVNLGNNTNWSFTSCAGYYWVGDSGNWSDFAHHWAYNSGGTILHNSAPTQFDDVYFDANSFTTANQVVTIDDPDPRAHNFSFASALYTPTLQGTGSATEINVYGSLKLITNMNQNFTGDWNFKASTDSNEINTGGRTLQRANFIGANNGQGGWILRNNLTVADAINLNNGTFLANGKEITAKYFNTSTSNTRTLDLGSSLVRIVDGGWNPSNLNNLTFEEGTSEIILKGSANSDFHGNGLTYHKVTFRPTTTLNSLLTGANTYQTLRFEGGVNATLEPVTQTANQFEFAGNCAKQIGIQSTIDGTQSTFNQASGSVTGSFINIKDNNATGGASYQANQSQNLGNTTGWNFTSAPIIGITTTSGLVACTVNNDGWAKVKVIQGTSPFTYLWSTNETTDSISHLIPGVYTVTVTDSNGCKATDAVSVVNEPSALAPVDWNASAYDICQGTTINFTPDEVSTALNFDSEDSYVQVPDIAALSPSNITVEAWIKANPFQSDYATIVDKGSTASSGWALQFNGSTGKIRFWTPNGTVVSSTTLNDDVWHHLAATYDGTNLKLYIDGVLENTFATASGLVNNATDLYIGNSISNGYNYWGLIDEVRIWSTARTVTDIQANRNIDLAGNEAGLVAYYNMEYLAGTNTLKDITANANDGTLTNMAISTDWVNPGAVNSSISYVWNFGDFTSSSQKTPSKLYAAPGTYTVSLGTYDQNGCPNFVTKTIRVSKVSYSVSKTNIACKGTVNGSIVITPADGIPPYAYSIDNGNTYVSTGSFTGLSAGTYQVMVKDSIGCTSTAQSYTITEPATVLSFSVANVPSCPGANNGSLTVSATGGTPPYQYSKNAGISFQNPTLFDQLAPGTYTIRVRDGNNCLAPDQTITVIDVDLSNAGGTISGSASVGAGTNSTTLALHGHTGTVAKWQSSADAVFTAPVDISNTDSIYVATNLTATRYFRAVINVGTCGTVNSDSALISVYPRPQGSLSANGPFCVSGAGALTWTATAGTGPFTLVYHDGTANRTVSNVVSGNPFSTFTSPVTANSTYTLVSVQDIYTNRTSGFTGGAATIVVNSLPSTTITASGPTTFCLGGSVTLSAPAGNAGYLWNTGATTQSIVVNTSGAYSVSVTSAQNCTDVSTATTVTVNPLPSATTSKVDVVCTGTSTGSITVNGNGGTAPYQYSINGGGTYQTSNIFGGLSVGNYAVYIKDANNCPVSIGIVDILQIDTTAPSITAPADITVLCASAVPAANTASVIATDNCSATVSFVGDVISNQTTPHQYAITRTYQAIDPSGNISLASQVITVNDNVGPTISNCPADINLIAATAAGAVATYTAPTAVDNCSGTVSLVRISGLSSGSTFPIGTTTVTYRATDVSGNITDCSFDVNITGFPPQINCPADIQVSNDAGECGAIVNFGATETTAIPASTITYSIQPGTFFPVGTTTVTATATNSVGTSSCSFTVTVLDTENPVFGNTISGTSCLTHAYNLLNTYADALGGPSLTPNGGTLGANDYSFSNNQGPTLSNAVSAGNYSIELKFTPSNTSGYKKILDFKNRSQDAGFYILNGRLNFYPVVTGPSVVFTNGVPVCVTLTRDGNTNEVKGYVNGVLQWSFIDGSSYATFTSAGNIIQILNDDLATGGGEAAPAILDDLKIYNCVLTDEQVSNNCAVVQSQQNITQNNDPGICGAIISYSTPVGVDNCPGANTVQTEGLPSGAEFPVGITTNTFVVTDASGNTASTSFTVTIADNEDPTITAPVNVAVSNDAGNCNAIVDIGTPVTGDNCGVASVTNDHASTTYPVGTTTVTWTVTDIHGNSSAVTQTITVTDNEPPTITAPANITVNNDGGTCSAVVNIGLPVTGDNCGVASVTNDHASTTYPVGTTTVTWTVTDIHGNSAAVMQTITVTDNENPTIAAPANVAVNNDAGNCSAIVDIGTPVTGDNCGVASVTNDHASTTYPVGTTVVTWTVTDIHGNSSQATQSVTVTDTELPNVITQPVSITLVNGETNVTAAMVDGGSTDNCGIASMTLSSPTQFHCSDIGDHTVTLTVTDIHGNVSSTSAIVTVLGAIPGCSITPIPTSNVYTGGNPYNLYLGYGPQSTVLQVNPTAVSGNGGPNYTYTYSWSGASVGMLNSTDSGAPEFTPTAAGLYEFTVTTTNQYGCSTTCTISICVRDIRVVDKKGRITDKVYVCHVPPGNNNNPQTLSISVNAVPAHLSNHSGDKLGSCDMPACGTASSTSTESVTKSITTEKFETTTTEETLKVTVMPNPSTTYFTLKLESKYETPVNMRVMDGSGRVVDAKSRIGANSTIQIGHNYSSGTYYAELIQGTQRKVVRLIKGRG